MKNHFLISLFFILLLLSGCKNNTPKMTLPEELPPVKDDLIISEPFKYKPLDHNVLKEDEVFVFGLPYTENYGYEPYSPSRTAFFDHLYIVSGKGNLLNKFVNVTLVDQSTGIMNTNEKKYMGIYQDEQIVFGLYDFKQMEWFIEPLYTDLYTLGEKYYHAVKDGKLGIIDEKGEVVVPFELESDAHNCIRYDQYFTFYSYHDNLYFAYDLKGNKVVEEGSLDIQGFGAYLILRDYSEQGESYLVDAQGNMLLTSILPSDLSLSYQQGENYLIYKDGINYTVYDANLTQILQIPIQGIDYIEMYDNYYSTFHSDGTLNYFWLDGKEILTPTGAPYTRSIPNYAYTSVYLISETDHSCEIYDPQSGASYSIAVGRDMLYYFDVFENGSYITVETANLAGKFTFYKEGTVFLTEPCDYYYTLDDWIILQRGMAVNSTLQGLYTVLDLEGNVIYKSKYQDRVSLIDDQHLYLQRGNYVGIADFDGNWIYKIGPDDF